MAYYPGYNLTIQQEIAATLIEAERTCTGPNATSIVDYAINLPNTHITFHTLMKILSGSFCIFVILATLFLIAGHIAHWAVPAEQKQIARVIAFLPVYSIGAFISIYMYSTQPYIAPVPDYYEGFSIVAIFLLFVTFINPDESIRDQFFNDIAAQKRSISSKKRPKKSGAEVFHRTCLFVFQIIPSRIATLVASEALYAATCPLSKKRGNALMIIQVVQAFSTTMAVVAVIRFEGTHNSRMQDRHPRLKLWTFKSIVFLEFVQNVVFSALASTETYRPTQYVSYYDMSIGLNQFIISCECFLYTFMYMKAFEFGSYRRAIKEGRCGSNSPLSAIQDIINPMDIIKGTLAAFGSLKKPERYGTHGVSHMVAANDSHHHPASGQAQMEHQGGSDSV
ncbi:hypothetical protein MMC18_001665 [Xylographa bjoerkii]|nr:hypothetical protein [Xylographa bjoerkii]